MRKIIRLKSLDDEMISEMTRIKDVKSIEFEAIKIFLKIYNDEAIQPYDVIKYLFAQSTKFGLHKDDYPIAVVKK